MRHRQIDCRHNGMPAAAQIEMNKLIKMCMEHNVCSFIKRIWESCHCVCNWNYFSRSAFSWKAYVNTILPTNLGTEHKYLNSQENKCWWIIYTYPKPFTAKLLNIGYDAQQRLGASIHCFSLDIAKPHLQLRRKIVAGQFKHSHITATIQIQRMHYRNWRYWWSTFSEKIPPYQPQT